MRRSPFSQATRPRPEAEVSTSKPVEITLQSEESSIKSSSTPNLVYEGTITGMIKGLKVFSVTTSLVAIVGQPYVFLQLYKTVPLPVLVFSGFLGVTAILSPLVLQWFTKRYVTHLYLDPQTNAFFADTLGLLGGKRSIQFKASEVTVPAVSGPFTSFIVKGKPYLVDPQLFQDMEAYKHLMGYDKSLEEIVRKPLNHRDEEKRSF
jgi:hypothetical protein